MNKIELIGIAIGIVATILGGVWFIFSKIFGIGRFMQRVEEMDKRTCNASCDVHAGDITEMKVDVKAVREDMVSVKSQLTVHDKDIESIKSNLNIASDNLAKVTSLLLLKYKDASKLLSAKNSPRQLNELGSKIFADIKGEEFLKANKDFLFAQIDTYNPKTALDVENAANLVCAVSTADERFNRIKNFIYNSPSYKINDEEGNEKLYDLALSDVCFVLSIPLRDMYLEEHTEITL